MSAVGTFELDDAQQRWRAPWYFFCGNCTPNDCAASCTAYWLPCVAYGYTTSKVFRTPFWREVLRFLAIFGIVALVSFVWAITRALTCPLELELGPEAAAARDPSMRCNLMALVAVLIKGASLGCAVYWAWAVGGPRRTQLRRLLGIGDSGAGGDCCACGYKGAAKGTTSDNCLHFWCLCCALAQEMRTVRHLEITGNLPKPAPEGYEPLLRTAVAPPVDGGMSRAPAPKSSLGQGDAMV